MPEDQPPIRPRVVQVTAPSRLHFGLLSFGQSDGRRFGGAGLMLAAPCCCLSVQPAESPEFKGEGSDRVREFATTWSIHERMSNPLACTIDVLSALPSHVGLGSGTQLALATAAALDRFWDRPRKSPAALARSVGRGLRSAVGTYGFCSGGFIAEPGKADGESIAPLGKRLEVPHQWRIVLIRPAPSAGVFGEAEKAAFSNMPPVPRATTEELKAELYGKMMPSLEAGDCKRFGESVYRYGCLAGKCFAAYQGGSFASEQLATIVACVRSLGVQGVGQSSWGPTLFAILPNLVAAEKLVVRLRDRFAGELEISISAPNNWGAEVAVE